MSDKQDIKSVQKYFRSNGFDTEGMYTSEKSGDITSFIARCENPKKEYGIVKAILNMGSAEIPDNILDQTDEIEIPGERKKKKITWDKLMFKNSSINKHEFKYAFIPISAAKSTKVFDPNELDKKDIIGILEDMDYNATICVEQNEISGGPYVYTFEAGSPDDELVLIRIVETGPNIKSHELSKYLYTNLKYKKPDGESCNVKWDKEAAYSEVPPRISKTLNNRLFYIVASTPTKTEIKKNLIVDDLDLDKKKKLVEKYLSDNGYDNLTYLASGSFGVVCSCNNKDNKFVAAKVVISDNKEIVDEELKRSKKVSDMKPIDTDRVKALAKTGSFGNDANVNRGLIKREKIFNRHINVPVIKHLNLDKKQGVYIAILEAPLMDEDLSTAELPPLPKDKRKDKINHKIMRKIIRSVLGSLKIMHERNIVHLDIKPANILSKKLDKDEIKFALTDFGLVSYIVFKKPPETYKFKPSELQELKDEFEQIKAHMYGTDAYFSPEVIAFYNYIEKHENVNSLLEKSDEIMASFDSIEKKKEDIKKLLIELRKIGPKSDIYSLGKTLIDIADKYIDNVSSIIPRAPGIHFSDKIASYAEEKSNGLSEEDREFFRFVAKLTQYEPEDRPTAKEALNDPYLKS